MRKVAASLFLSLDGVMEAPETWNAAYFDEEMGAAIGQAMSAADAFLLGRRTYEEWAAYWPGQAEGNPMAAVVNGLPKYVVSRTLDEVTWQNSRLLRGDLEGELAELRQQPGKEISVVGSATLVRSLLRDGQLDELRLMIHPLVLGTGRPLFENGTPRVPLELVAARTFGSGVLGLTYRPVRD